jgi:hypothetical protein
MTASHVRDVSAAVAPRWARALALALFSLSLGMLAFAIASLVIPGTDALPKRPTLLTVLIVTCVLLSYPLVGTLVAIRRPENPIGWLFIVLGLGFTVGYFSTEYVSRALISGWPLPGAALVGWIGNWSLAAITGIAFAWIPLLFPTGHLPGPRWRIVAWALAITMALGITSIALRPGPLDATNFGDLANPFAAPGLAGLLGAIDAVYDPAVAILGVICVGSLFVRFRRSSAVERQQIKWLMLATASFIVTLGVALATQADGPFLLALVAAAGIPISAGVAILRYRLWDIDRLVSRSIGWAVVTAMLAAVFAALVVILQAVLSPITSENTLAVAASTLVAFALFQPLRRRVQRAVDRRFDRARYDGQRTVDAFAEHLRSDVDLGSLRGALAATADQAVRPVSASVWLSGRTTR